MMAPWINHFIFIGVILLGLGIYTIISNSNIIKILIGVSMIFLASIINFAAFSNFGGFNTEGQFIIFIISALSVFTLSVGIILRYSYGKSCIAEGEDD
jgi:NADH:ubiquinone oxidoreductase subunit K